jgi:ribonuclease E
MLIDATHPEETRVVVQRNGRVEEFDFESAARKLLRGSIYLAKVTRVEPSLQAAFVDYGGNRHGFLAFNEIHPDYYQIPVADRQALLDEEAAAEAELEAAADRRAEALARKTASRTRSSEAQGGEDAAADNADLEVDEAGNLEGEVSHIVDVEEEDEHIEEVGGDGDNDGDSAQTIAAAVTAVRDDVIAEDIDEAPSAAQTQYFSDERDDDGDSEDDDTEEEDESGEDETSDDDNGADEDAASASDRDDAGDEAADASAEHAGEARDVNADLPEEAPARPRRRPRSYKIQEVIKRRQVILVQVVKEERGNKGAALTTYLSLAGRYTVLMPNTARGGGISRKITNPQDRKRLKAIAQELEVPEGMGLIIRTAGAARTKQEIKRDFEYLLRLWESVRELTLQSTAPSLVYEEGDLIKRSIRDLYNKDVEEVVVAGEGGYQEAAEFMQMLMPSHARNVVPYRDPTPLFTRYGVERQLNAMFQPQVTLRSGGYIVINQTEALVAIDVNSGKSTREFSIEETALATNLEAADEISRQLKLRDLAGLIVIDFIDMEEKRNNRAVERRLKEALRFDRARIQLGRISHFGLMEMSRQRLRTGVLEGSTSQCPHCQGTGIIRSTESIALAVLRGLEDAITAGVAGSLVATTTPNVALYILNSKRNYIVDMEARLGHSVTIVGSDRVQGAHFAIERGAASAIPVRRPERAAVNMNWGFEGDDEAPSFESAGIEIVGDEEDDSRRERSGRDSEDGGSRRGGRRKRRGRGRGGRGDRSSDEQPRSDLAEAAFNDGEEGSYPADDQGPMDADGPADYADDDADRVAAGDDADGQSERSEDGKSERGSRRRRRGRRGGRRGRGREARDAANLNTAEDQEPTAGEGDEPSSFSQSDDLDVQVDTGADIERVEASSESTEAAANGETEFGDPSVVLKRQTERSRPERIWDVPTAANAADDVAPPAPEVNGSEHAASSEESESAKPAEAAPARRRHELGSSEPRVERVVVKSGDEASEALESQAAPQRKGWWQRKFGAE